MNSPSDHDWLGILDTLKDPSVLAHQLLREAERDAHRILRERMAWGTPIGHQFLAAVFASRGDTQGAVRALQRAVTGFEAPDMKLYAATARRRLGALTGGQEGREVVSDADAFLVRQGIARPEYVTRMLAPGFDE